MNAQLCGGGARFQTRPTQAMALQREAEGVCGGGVAVAGLARRFALTARPARSQDFARDEASDNNQSKNTNWIKKGGFQRGKEGGISKEL
jgi:hypothetical protein